MKFIDFEKLAALFLKYWDKFLIDGDLVGVGDLGDFGVVALVVVGLGVVILVAASDQGQRHNQSQDHSKKLLHGYSTFLNFLFSRLAAGKPVSRHGEAPPPVPCAL